VIWTAQGKYLSLNSTEETASKHSGIFWALSQACLAVGGIFLYLVFHFAGEDITESTVLILYGVFTAVTLVGAGIFILLRMPGSHLELESQETFTDADPELSHWEVMLTTFKLLQTKEMLLMTVVFMYTGVELSFWSSIYPTCIANTNKLGATKSLLALNAIAQGLGQAASGFLFGILSSKTRRFGRTRIVLLGTVIHLAVFAGAFVNFPKQAPLDKTDAIGIIYPSIAVALLCGFFLGFGDACWNTQIFSFIISRYPTRSAQAFSLFKFFQSLLTCAAFFYGTALELQWHMIILVVGAILGCLSFVVAEKVPVAETTSTLSSHSD
jgi:hypothetical protein